MRQEIGSEFHNIELFQTDGASTNIVSYLAEYNSVYFDSGRSALRAILKQLKHRRILLPNYICESVRECFSNDEVLYYQVDEMLCIDWNDLLNKSQQDIDILYIHFFNGNIQHRYNFVELIHLKEKFGFTIIEDTTHSFLSNKCAVGDYCVCSLRKWFPIPDGGVLYSKSPLEISQCSAAKWSETKRVAMNLKRKYLFGEETDKNAFLSMFCESEHELDEQKTVFRISEYSLEILKRIKIDIVKEKRKQNHIYLSAKLSDLGYTIVPADGIDQIPIFCVLELQNRNEIRSYLIDNHIYCPIHWPLYDELKCFSSAVNNNKKLLSIPIDQRYDTEDMAYIVDCLNRFKMQTKEKCK